MLLVTGHKGFIGCHLTKNLKKNNIDYIGADKKEGLDIRFHLDKLPWENIDKIIHLAAVSNVRDCEFNPQEAQETNVTALRNLIEKSKYHNIDKFIFASSAAVYGNNSYTPLNENSHKFPNSVYGKTKLEGEKWLLESSKELDMNILRFFNIYGKGSQGFMSKLEEHIESRENFTVDGYGKLTRDFIHINDIVDVLIRCLEPTPDIVYNVGSGKQTSLYDILRMYSKHTRLPTVTLRKEMIGIEHSQSDITKIKDDLHWYPKITLEDYLNNI